MVESDNKAAELAEIVQEIRERVRARYPTEGAGGLRLPDMMPVTYAREVAAQQVAAIGRVNPRPPGLLNEIAQSGKKMIARGLNWFVRDQVEFNRNIVRSIDTLIEVQNETNRALTYLGNRSDAVEARAERIQRTEAALSGSLETLERELSILKKSLADSQRQIHATQTHVQELHSETDRQKHSLIASVQDWNQKVENQHREFAGSIAEAGEEIQKRFWKEVEAAIAAHQAVIHNELRLIRQRAAITLAEAPAIQPAHVPQPQIDWMLFAQKFRGTEEAIKNSFRHYGRYFEGTENVLDIGCGRGEFLELMQEAGISARGIDLSAENVAFCTSKKLDTERADAFPYLESVPDHSLGGIFCAQVIEHLTSAQTINLVNLCAQKLKPGSPVIFETPNPECLAIFASHFYIDPTHIRPVPPPLLKFYLEEAGFGLIEVIRLASAEENMPSLRELPENFRREFFGSPDYAIAARKL